MKLRIVKEHSKQATQTPGVKIRRFDASMIMDGKAAPTFEVIKDGEHIKDYKNVKIRGYLSTFKHVTESDRDGDYVDKGSFVETIPKFMRNPVLLVNHQKSVDNLAGRFTNVREDEKGLYVEAELSNAPGNIDNRFKVAEGMLKTLSMGGMFHYKEDGRGIFKVDLWEGSLTPLPANPDAMFSVREPTEEEMKKALVG